LEHKVCLSAVSLFELIAGVSGTKRLTQIDALCSIIPIVAVTELAARKAGEFYTSLKEQGLLIGNEDLLLAGTAHDLNLPLLTRNHKHFSRIRELVVVSPEDILTDQ